MKLVVAGGGTGGHFFPALAILMEARERKVDTFFVGSLRGIERSMEGEIPGEKAFLELYPFRRVSIKERWYALKSYWKSAKEINSRLRGPFASILLGGYVSVPTGITSAVKRQPLFIHEQNSVPSMTNRSFSLIAKKVFITFEHTKRYFRGRHVVKTGLPVRKDILDVKISKENARSLLGFEGSPVVLFMGGSQGAKFLNTLALDFAKKTGANTLLLSGIKDYERVKKLGDGIENLKIFPFRTDMANIYSATDVAVCRAGAGTLTELSLFGVPAVMIPFPYAAGDHQMWNALEIENLGGGITVPQEEATTESVISAVDRIIKSHGDYSSSVSNFAVKEASSRVLDEILEDLG